MYCDGDNVGDFGFGGVEGGLGQLGRDEFLSGPLYGLNSWYCSLPLLFGFRSLG